MMFNARHCQEKGCTHPDTVIVATPYREVGRGRKRPPPPVDEFIDTADDDHHDGGGGVSIDISVCEWHGACRECIRTGRLH